MTFVDINGAGERTPLLGEVTILAPSNGYVARKSYRPEEGGNPPAKELSGGRLALVLGVVWLGSFLAAFGNKKTGTIFIVKRIFVLGQIRLTSRWR
jgi:hypothetical protein